MPLNSRSSDADGLNTEQRAAVIADHPALIIAAGPGTGKTRTLTHRIAHLIGRRGLTPPQILAVTFTRAAAGEIKARLQALLAAEKDLGDLWVETFHALALRILNDEGFPFGVERPLSPVTDDEKPAFLEGLVAPRERPRFLDELRRKKQRLEPPHGLGATYQERLTAAGRVDFDDLFLLACRLFEERPEVAERYRTRFRAILVDEFQDTSFAQYEFLRRLAAPSVCVIGDPDQAIYGFSGGSFSAFERFKRDFPDHVLLPLSDNHRSQAMIVEAAQQVIARSAGDVPRGLVARLERGLPIEIGAFATGRIEAEMVVRRIEALLGGASEFTIDTGWAQTDEESRAYGLDDIVILYRFHAQARRFEQALERSGLPYRTLGRKKTESASIDGDDRHEVQMEEAAPAGEAIRLMTLHRSKGLEFPVVFIAGCEEGVLPFAAAEGEADAQLEEERRLFYVGMTRAKSRLFLSHAARRFLFGQALEKGPSRFLADIEKELLSLRETEARRPVRRRETQLDLFG